MEIAYIYQYIMSYRMLYYNIAYLTSNFYWEIRKCMFQKILITIQFGDLLKKCPYIFSLKIIYS